jgi:general secretion pathway protein L
LDALSTRPPRQGRRETWLELAADDVLLRTTALPAQVRDKLHQVLAYELDRLTPFPAAEVYYDARVLGPVARGTKLSVEVAVCRRDGVSDWLERLREGRSPAARLTWEGAWPEANLLPPADRPRPSIAGTLLTQLLAIVVLLLLATVLATPIWQRQQMQQTLDAELRRVRTAAVEVEAVREELERARLGSVEVLNRKLEQPRMTGLLKELTELLPDGTWVQTLNVRDGEVDIRGESDQATALIGRLESGPGISAVRFRSPVMQVANTGMERFHISFSYSQPQVN